jgi:hypothetical protein
MRAACSIIPLQLLQSFSDELKGEERVQVHDA